MSSEQRSSLSYLMRLWKTDSEGEGVWRASLESPDTGQRKGFATLRDLFAFLEQATGRRGRGETTPDSDEKGGDAGQADS